MIVKYGKGFAVQKAMRQKVVDLQAHMSKLPQYEPDTKNHFHAGMYCREVSTPADSLIVGAVHKKEHFLILNKGIITITEGAEVERFEAPRVIASSPGAKRAIYCETDVIFMTVHKTDARTVEQAENELVEADPLSMFGVGNKLKEVA